MQDNKWHSYHRIIVVKLHTDTYEDAKWQSGCLHSVLWQSLVFKYWAHVAKWDMMLKTE